MRERTEFSMKEVESRVIGYIPSTNGGRIYIVGPPEDAQSEKAWDDLHKTIAELVIENEKDAQ